MLRLDFCRLVDLESDTKRIIRRRMSWKDEGAIKGWLKESRTDVHLCLLYNGQLATWVSLDSKCCIGAWTSSRYRRRGFAQAALWALIDYRRKALKITRQTTFRTYHPTIRNAVMRLGYKTF